MPTDCRPGNTLCVMTLGCHNSYLEPYGYDQHWPSGLFSCHDCPDEANKCGSACRATSGYPNDLNDPHVMREASNAPSANNHEHRQDGYIRSKSFHTYILSQLHRHSSAAFESSASGSSELERCG